ncbi:MAG: hypothetical protein IJT00_06390 [Lachnospiraceae bacterium]|nr:hypothetical protein [Lachnospiraceae bacterium]
MRRVSTDFEPDIKRARELIKKGIGSRPLAHFARAAGINNSYLCKYLKGHFDRPLTPAILLKIAAAAWDGVTAEELLTASGYSIEKYLQMSCEEMEEEEELPSLDELHERTFLKKSAYLWFIVRKGFRGASIKDDGGPVVLMEYKDEAWLLIFMNVRDGRACTKAREGLLMFDSMTKHNRRLCIVVDDPKLCTEDFLTPSLNRRPVGMILYVDPYTGGAKRIGGSL